MCYHKSVVQKIDKLIDHYPASFKPIRDDLESIEDRFHVLMKKDDRLNTLVPTDTKEIHSLLTLYSQKDSLPASLTKPELSDLKYCLKALSGFREDGLYRYHENGFDYLPTPIITAGDPENFKLFRWGLIPYYMSDKDKAMVLRTQTLNCISEEMFDKPSFRDAFKNEQRCLIPVTGFYEWRWLDKQGSIKIPYYVTFRDQKPRSIAGLYSRWKDKDTNEYYYSYTVLTTRANTILDYVHNNKKRMPVFIAPEDEKTWLTKGLSKDQVLQMCQPYEDNTMRAYTISKHITTKNILTNTPEVMVPFNYNKAIHEADQFLQRGERQKALAVFKESMSASADVKKVDDQELKLITAEGVKPELEMV